MSYPALVYSHSITPRVQYIVDFLSGYYGLSFKLTDSEEKYLSAGDVACKINYSHHRLANGEIWIHSHVLLSESFIRPLNIQCLEINKYKAFFATGGDMGFDLLAAIFYLLTRYEEYLPYQKDEYGRYAHENSLAFKEGFLHLPLINIWLEDFRIHLARKNIQFTESARQFSFVPTYDIDMAWSYLHKGFKRNAGGIALSFIKGKWGEMTNRIRVLRQKKQDPFDAYNWMDSLHKKYGLKPVYFFLVAKETNRYDKNTHTESIDFQQLIHSIAQKYDAGLHPSWASGELPSLLIGEKQLLEHFASRPIEASRQHFIRFFLPATYQRLLATGIKHEYSMGYGSINGFRASIALPFYWYDLKNEQITKLQVHPFCFMDANSFYEQKVSAQNALEELMQFHTAIKAVNGTMYTIWHNSFLGNCNEFEGWRDVYEEFVKKTK